MAPRYVTTPCAARLRAEEGGDPAGAPAVPRLDTYSAHVAEGSGGNLPAILGLRSMSNRICHPDPGAVAREDDYTWL
eukprot:5028638-Pyramimonas_sp.AAC.2